MIWQGSASEEVSGSASRMNINVNGPAVKCHIDDASVLPVPPQLGWMFKWENKVL